MPAGFLSVFFWNKPAGSRLPDIIAESSENLSEFRKLFFAAPATEDCADPVHAGRDQAGHKTQRIKEPRFRSGTPSELRVGDLEFIPVRLQAVGGGHHHLQAVAIPGLNGKFYFPRPLVPFREQQDPCVGRIRF